MIRNFAFGLAVLALTPGVALAHPGHDAAGFWSGLHHPLSGADHVLAMVSVGLWAALAGGRAVWAAPCSFVAAMLAGGALAMAGVALPAVEPVIFASIIVLGAMVGMALRLPLRVALPVIALFGLAHGAAHGIEAPAAGTLGFGLGFAAATALLHGAGLALGLSLQRGAGRGPVRVLGGLTAALGAALALAG